MQVMARACCDCRCAVGASVTTLLWADSSVLLPGAGDALDATNVDGESVDWSENMCLIAVREYDY